MVSEQLQKKIDRAIKLLQAYNNPNEPVEIAYSGGKDSDVILQLAKEAGMNYRAIYKNTTIDPPGTIKHVKEMGVEMVMPKDNMTFFKWIEKKGFPSRLRRYCCDKLKEYKILDKAVIGVRKEESRKRNERYQEPTACRIYGSKKNHVEQIYPILDWTTEDVAEYLKDRAITCAPIYYEGGVFHPERRLGCMCCPLQGEKKRIREFLANPRMVKAYCIAGQKYRDTHPNVKTVQAYDDVYEWFYRNIFFVRQSDWEESKRDLFGKQDYKKMLEDYFKIKL